MAPGVGRFADLPPDAVKMMRETVLCIGVAVRDLVFRVDAMPTSPEKYRAQDYASVGGGCAATAAVAVARLGGRARLATRLGDDAIGRDLIAELEQRGVDCSPTTRWPGRRSALSAVLVDALGERLIVNYRDPDLPSDAAALGAALPADIGAVLADTRWTEGAAHGLELARKAGIPGVLDCEAPFDGMSQALAAASHLAYSAQGLRAHTGRDDLADAVRDIARAREGFVCVTDGAAGVWWHDDRSAGGHVPALPIRAVDTLGAGDVWHGAFALALARDLEPAEAIRFANAAAAVKCTRVGGWDAVPDANEVNTYLTPTNGALGG